MSERINRILLIFLTGFCIIVINNFKCMKYIRHFEDYSDFENVRDSLVRPNLSFIEELGKIEILPYDGQQGGVEVLMNLRKIIMNTLIWV